MHECSEVIVRDKAGEGGRDQMWKAKLRTLTFTLSIMRNHSKVLNRGME